MERVINFFQEIEKNNNRDWFTTNKETYIEAKDIFLDEIQKIINELQLIDPELANLEAKDTIFRIYRDVRFSKDKLPYKTHIAAYMAKGGKKSMNAGYYVHISGSEFFLGAGVHSPQKEALHAIRSEILYQPEAFSKIVNACENNKFRLFEEDKLKTGPKDFPKDSPYIEYLKLKHFLLSKDIPKTEIINGNLAKVAINMFRELHPFVNFLNQSMEFQGNE